MPVGAALVRTLSGGGNTLTYTKKFQVKIYPLKLMGGFFISNLRECMASMVSAMGVDVRIII